MNSFEYLCRLTAVIFSIIGIAVSSYAQSGERWEASFEATSFYDSQLAVEEADVSQESGDIGIQLGVNLNFKPVKTETLDVEIAYKFGQTLHTEFSEFDLQSHRASASLTRRIGKVRIGLRADGTNIRLANDPFLNLLSVSPSVGIFLQESVFLRGHIQVAEKSFTELEQRNASIQQAGANLFRFHKGGRGYLQGSLLLERENAVDPALDFDGVSGSVAWKHPLGSDRDAPSIKLTADYRHRDYDAITPVMGAERTETRFRTGADLECILTQELSAEIAYRYTDRNSNFPSADYNEHRAALKLMFRF
ncbi:outer membrane beta-barrel protein [Sphingomicrobium clamense]|uniref:DUF560 domain-containing protein n=1 Tax=Sphingomicrobium clamense TaxID=2851013 RepID=A0ABS6V7C4_9SPHN|nr:outer membrane beta-barrel protein [Sphingomicrobium sp. B8]MBW0145404.1 DUF560 domain-containing protein [Sphingomicrobium sp. B8]